jgi:signal transduction histidine kinase
MPMASGPDPQPRSAWTSPTPEDGHGPLRERARALLRNPVAQGILEAVEGYVALLDEERRILAANEQLERALAVPARSGLWGRRPGEAAGCVHAGEGPEGCGTGPACSGCGVLLAVQAAQAGQGPDTRECHLTLEREGRRVPGAFRVRATAIDLEGRPVTVAVFQDISDARRREALEAIFFHDLLNLAGSLQGLSRSWLARPAVREEMAQAMLDLSGLLVQEILGHKLLVNAERGELAVDRKWFRPGTLLEDLGRIFRSLDPAGAAGERNLVVPEPPGEGMVTDPALLGRILVNMVKNAIEATRPGETITLALTREGEEACFRVHNPGAIPAGVAARIFERSFTTKAGAGRGLGTYGMKLFGERFLGGRVDFTTSPASGTTFSLRLPAGIWSA